MGFEMQILESWEDWNDIDIGVFQFTNCILKKNGAKIPFVTFNLNTSTVQFLDNDGYPTAEYKLIVSLGDKIS